MPTKSIARAACALLFLIPFSAWAQLGGPVLGYVPDSGSIRPIYGIPAAAAVADPLTMDAAVSSIVVSPRQDFALATAADTGTVLLLQPESGTMPLDAVATGADSITMSPGGSSAILWWNSVSNFQIVGGLPDAPAVLRTVNTSFLGGAPSALAISDDGQWTVGVWSSGAYAFGPDGEVNLLPVQGAVALAFLHGGHDLAVASALQISTVTDVGGAAAVATVYDASANPIAPLAIAASFDNRFLTVAQTNGLLITVDLSSGAAASVTCNCAPQGLFGMNGAIFRLTDQSSGAVTMYDASIGQALIVPMAGSDPAAQASRALRASRANDVALLLPAAPSVTITPTTATPAQQPNVSLTLGSPYALDIAGTITLTFASSVGGDDQLIAFSSGGRTVNFTVPAGTTKAIFSGTSGTVSLLTGTVAGTITLTASLTAQGTPLAPQPNPVTIVINSTPPVITSVVYKQGTNGFTLVVTGFSNTRDMTSGLFHFAPTTGNTLAQSDITVQLSSAYATWYQNSASNAFGSEFTLTMPFTTQGPMQGIVAATVTLTNSKGVSNPSNPANP